MFSRYFINGAVGGVTVVVRSFGAGPVSERLKQYVGEQFQGSQASNRDFDKRESWTFKDFGR